MLVSDLKTIGSNLYKVRKLNGLTQAEVAEKADVSDRTYADIERGSVTMRIDTFLKICKALKVTPNDILVAEDLSEITEQKLLDELNKCSNSEKETALKLLSIYIDSL
ncbi:MAG: helix-turn-helix domain-containing protein [Clostridiales bacterium]|nr:helix-turn-helix domain-containing protein [Clostridiales bacterium]